MTISEGSCQKRDINLKFVSIENKLANILTKSLPPEHFCGVRRELDIGDLPLITCA